MVDGFQQENRPYAVVSKVEKPPTMYLGQTVNDQRSQLLVTHP